VTFNKSIDPTTFTVGALSLTRNGTNVPLSSPPVTFTTTDNTTFTVGGLTNFTKPEGSYVLTVSAANVEDPAGNKGTGSQTVNFTVDTGPKVSKLQRFGFHNQPTLLVLTFDRALDPAGATDPNNYSVLAAPPGGRLSLRHGVVIPIASGAYDATNNTVTLVMARVLSFFQPYILIARGTGQNPIKDTLGFALDGKGNGTPGTDFVTVFNHRIVAGPASAGSTTVQVSIATTSTEHIPNSTTTTTSTTYRRLRPSQVIQTV
jgi:hypothetical protein